MITSDSSEAPVRRILLVDDDRTLRQVVAETLRGEGYLIDEAEDGAAALDRLRAVQPDLILLDLAMPVLDGQDFIERYCAERGGGDTPIVIVSATPILPAALQATGVKAVLVKPFDLSVLLAMVERFTRLADMERPSQCVSRLEGGVDAR